MNANEEMTVAVPGYELKNKIEEEGETVTETWQAKNEETGQLVTLKLLNKQAEEFDRKNERRFINDCQALSRLNHPNILKIYKAARLGEKYFYMVTENIPEDAKTLKDTLSNGPLPEDQALRCLKEIASALTLAHEADILHRALRPQSVLIRKDGSVALSNFGSMKKSDEDATQMAATVIGQNQNALLDNIFYKSPEQCRGRRGLDARTDIYSLGVIFHEMLTGNRPFTGKNEGEVMIEHIKNPVPKLPPELSQHQQLLNKMLAKNPLDRYSSGKQLFDILDGNKTTSNPATPKNQVFAWKWIATAIISLTVLIGIAIFFYNQNN